VAARASGRAPDELRPVVFIRDFTEMADGSVLVEFGRTRVLCTASVEARIPPWLKNSGKGWVTGPRGLEQRKQNTVSGFKLPEHLSRRLP
jgi:ribonuclease PH